MCSSYVCGDQKRTSRSALCVPPWLLWYELYAYVSDTGIWSCEGMRVCTGCSDYVVYIFENLEAHICWPCILCPGMYWWSAHLPSSLSVSMNAVANLVMLR